MKGMDLASALAGPVQGSGALEGARAQASAGSKDTAAFAAVLNDVQGSTDSTPGLAPDAGSPVADDARNDTSSGTLAQQPGGGADGGAATALDPSAVANAANAASLSGTPYAAAVAQLPSDGQAVLPDTPPAVSGVPAVSAIGISGVPATGSPDQAGTPVVDSVTATSGPRPGLDPRFTSVTGLQPGTGQPVTAQPSALVGAPGEQIAGMRPSQELRAAVGSAAVSGADAGVSAGNATSASLGAQQPAGAQDQTLAPSNAVTGAPPTHPGMTAPAGTSQESWPVQTVSAVTAATAATAATGAPGAPAATPTVAATPAVATPTAPAVHSLPATVSPAAAGQSDMPAGNASGFPGTALAEGSTSGIARTETAPAAASAAAPGAPPADALAATGNAAAATPVSQPTSSAAAAPQPAAPAAPQPGATLQPQLAKPLFTLAGAPQGQHIMTLQVTPEDLGPMTVRAHIDAAGVRIELFAPGDAGREAIRGILPELRKELADAGFGASLDVSEHSGPGNTARDGTGQDTSGQDRTGRDGGSGSGSRSGPGGQRPGHRWEALADGAALRDARILNGPQTTLDILV